MLCNDSKSVKFRLVPIHGTVGRVKVRYNFQDSNKVEVEFEIGWVRVPTTSSRNVVLAYEI